MEELIPASALAEILYCPRSFYYQIAYGRRKLQNVHTVEGFEQDKLRQERGSREDFFYNVKVYSQRLGIVGVLDAVAVREGELIPIEYKRGRRTRPSEADEVLLGALAMALEECSGREVRRGYLYYTGSRKQFEIPVDHELRVKVETLALKARQILEAGEPPPAVRDARCRGCSFEPWCFPGLINALRGRPGVVPQLFHGRVLYVETPGASVSARGGAFEVRLKGEVLARVPPEAIESIVLIGNTHITTPAIKEAIAKGIDVVFTSKRGTYLGRVVPAERGNAFLRIRQHQVAESQEGRLRIATGVVFGKIRNMRVLLQRHQRRDAGDFQRAIDVLGRLEDEAKASRSVEELRGVEGEATRVYFSQLALLFEDAGVPFPERTRRPPLDPANALLSYLYSLLARDAHAAVLRANLDPYIGFLHSPKYGRPAVALDLMEEFRPVVADSLALALFRRGTLSVEDFANRFGVWELGAHARRRVLSAYEERMSQEVLHPLFKKRYSLRRVLEAQARFMAKVIEGDWPRYEPYTWK